MNKISLITSDKIYYKLKWHEKADTKKATITYLNLGKLKTISFHDWIPFDKGGEIPWHRIYQFHYQNEILWDRTERIMNLDLLNKEEIFNNIDMLKFDNKKWINSNNNQDILPNEITIISFNCLMDIYDKNITDVRIRLPVILDYLEKYNADIVCLQEITIKMKQYLMKQDFIKKNYYITSNEPKIYGQIILSKFKPLSQNLVTLNGNHMKKYLHLLFTNNNEENIELYNVHLTSDDQINSENKRNIQLDQINNQIKKDRVILCGDFNGDFDINSFYDIWKFLKPDDDGFTIDYYENELYSKLTKTFNRKRIDKIFLKDLKPLSIDLVFKDPINKIFASDHFGLLSKISTNDKIDNNDIYCNEPLKNNNYSLIPGNLLCIILEPKYWKNLNNIRKFYDEGYNKIPPHVTLFQKFIDINEWIKLKDNLMLIDDKIIFDKLDIFKLSIKYVLVLTCDENYKINQIRNKLENIINIEQTSIPHITLGEFDSEKKALSVKNNLEKILKENLVEVNLNNANFMKKVNDQYIIYDTIGKFETFEALDLVKLICENITNDFEIKIIGSRVFGIVDSDYDIVILGNIDEEIFNNKFFNFSRMTPYFKYSKLLESKMNSINLITNNNEEINLIYSNKKNTNIYVNDSIKHIEIVKDLTKDNFKFFCDCYYCIRTWAIKRKIYGSKYGYLNGISWLYLTLNLFLKDNFKNKKIFVKEFFNFYINYDWNIPININNLIIEKKSHSDKIVYISSLTINSSNIVRNITPNSWNIILEEQKISYEICKNNDMNLLYNSKSLNKNLIKITINDQFYFNRVEKKNKISSEIWKLNIKNHIEPNIKWIEQDDSFIYYIGLKDTTDLSIIFNYFKKFNVIYEMIK